MQNDIYSTFFKIIFSAFGNDGSTAAHLTSLSSTQLVDTNITTKQLANMAEPLTVVKEATRVSWNDTNRRHFVNAMMNDAAKGTFVDNGFKKQSWHSIMLEFI
jgi:hypothetical protein